MIDFNLTTCGTCGAVIGIEAKGATYTGKTSNQKNIELHNQYHLKINKAFGKLLLGVKTK